jgi:hypothetical protein
MGNTQLSHRCVLSDISPGSMDQIEKSIYRVDLACEAGIIQRI